MHVLPRLFRTALMFFPAAMLPMLPGRTVAAPSEAGPSSAPSAAEAQDKGPTEQPPIEALIRQLGDKDYYVRQRAQDELAKLGFEAMEALNAAANDDDLEIASRAKYLLRLMRVEWTAQTDSPRVKHLLQGYETLDGRAREDRMQSLAELPDAEGVPALCRLVRFERSGLFSKAAAATLLFRDGGSAEPPDQKTIQVVRRSLQGCTRPGAAWLKAWIRLAEDPQAALAEWNQLVGDEAELLRKASSETSPEIVSRLARFQVVWLQKLGKDEEASAAIGRMVESCRGDADSIVQLLDWLVERKAWKAVDDLARRFAPQFAAEPGLLYILACAHAERGDHAKAEEFAAQALRLFPDKQEEHLVRHYALATMLRDRGRFAWARREFEHVIAKGDPNGELTVSSRVLLSEMYHDQGQDEEAAAALEELVKAIDEGRVTQATLLGRDPKEIRSRRHYFLACHWAAQGDAARQLESLDRALEADPEDIDVLIACYKLEGRPAEYRTKISALIRETAAKLHAAIADDPEDPAMYNQYAGLVGNTEGDKNEALRCSQKSLELRPNEGGYYDTLAHVYFGRGEYENAVKYQAKAAELEPHSGLIRKQLDVFRKKLDERKAASPK